VPQAVALPEGRWFSRPEPTEQASWTSRPPTRMTICSALGQVGLCAPDTHEFNSPRVYFSDMLGFKLEAPRREGVLKDKARPIYLDMQVRHSLTKLPLF